MFSPQTTITTTMSTTLKHHKSMNSGEPENGVNSILIPGLPNHLSHLCLSTLHPSLLYPVCRSWRRLLYSPSFPPFFSLYTLLSPTKSPNSIEFFSLDPISSQWWRLPPPPPLHLVRRHPSFISRALPIQSLTVSGHLVLIAATTHHLLPALHRPLLFNPLSMKWLLGPPLSTPRRWCAAGSARGAIYVASGIGSGYHADVARSVEKWDLKRTSSEWEWERMNDLKDGRFSREAIEIVGLKEKLWMVNVKGNASKQGAVYDVVRDKWEEMPEKAVAGWSGPAAVVEEEEGVMYVVDEKKGSLRKYDSESECWEVVVEESEALKGAEQMAAGRGRVCVVGGGGGLIAVVDVVARPARVRVLNPPPGMEVVAVHILPRMTSPE